MENNKKNKIKTQKIAGIFLIVAPLIILLIYADKLNWVEHKLNSIAFCTSLLALIVFGICGLRNSLWKEKQRRK